jgi:hypothetical protein
MRSLTEFVGLRGLLYIKRLQPLLYDDEINDDESDIVVDGIPIFSRGPQCK